MIKVKVTGKYIAPEIEVIDIEAGAEICQDSNNRELGFREGFGFGGDC
ncbi:MAG: hypothetical protein MJY92_01310 [Bacteroidales bacterium]|nr:hypothetical protein [Bacteroidales bacterium]